ncbi:hypothetical protein JG687_00011561 [Phytophthora cactorum]|uniref:Uncharacterized protein n=1 Tax=Phytophthora cactorum TaxID=29920 RepID=A0A8T1U830_9STRA|nr:hypothetical protein JG687_00011561 [Phytophthora cactorum]
MRMEVREVGAAASAAEASVSSEVALKAAERLHEVLEERQRWISKREEALERKEKLQKLLQLQDPTDSNIEQVEHQKAKEKAELVKQEETKASKAAAAALARKKELKELQARAEAAREKQQAAAIVLARSLKQLQAKRKREEKEADEHPRKKFDVGSKDEVKAAVTPEMHSFATAQGLDVGTAELAKAACFRIATRHLAQTTTSELISLNVSGNELVELPMGMRQLTNLQKLDASENALLEFPACVNSLIKLKELRFAHNNMTTISMPTLSPRLNVMDIRWNAVAHLRASDVATLTKLEILQAEENDISANELSKISDLLSRREVTLSDVVAQTTEAKSSSQQEEKLEDIAMKQPAHTNLSESNQVEVTNEAEGTRSVETEKTSIAADDVSATPAAKEGDGDQIMEEESANEAEGEGMVVVEKVDSSCRTEDDDNHIMVDESDDDPSVSEEEDGDQIMTQTNAVRIGGSFTAASTVANIAVEQPKEIIELDGPDSTDENDENDEETTAPEVCHEATSSKETEGSSDMTKPVDALPISTGDDLSTEGIAEAEDFAQNHSEVVTASAVRRQSSHDVAAIARGKLTAYMDQNQIDNRAEVRRRNPTLWREFLAASLPVNLELPACRLCFAPNDGPNQRLNSTVLCVRCLEDALLVLKERDEQSEVTEEIV